MRASSSFTRLDDRALLHVFAELVARTRVDVAELVICMAEVDQRRLYAPAGYPSMFIFCVEAFHMSHAEAYLRIRAARASRRFPALLPAIAEGRLHLTAVALLVPYLTRGNFAELMESATHRTKMEIKELLARRFPRPDMPARVTPLRGTTPGTAGNELRPDAVGTGMPENELRPDAVGSQSPGPAGIFGNSLRPDAVAAPGPRPSVSPLAPARFGVQFTMDQETRDLLEHVQALLGGRVPSGDLGEVFKQALRALTGQLEKQKFAATDTPRPRRRCSRSNPRHIPAHVKREVWKRDGGRCTFVGHDGHRCDARKFLEFDHAMPVARGGEATVRDIRLRCRTHNQHEAERVFGREFMEAKREAGRRPLGTAGGGSRSARGEPSGHLA